MSLIHHAASNSLWVFLGRVSERIVRIVVVIFLARIIGPNKFGIYSYAFAIAEIFAVIAEAGMQRIVVREIASDSENSSDIFGAGLILRMVFSFISWLAICVVAILFVSSPLQRWSILSASLIVFVSFRVASLRQVFDAPFEAKLEMGLPSCVFVLSELVAGLALVLFASMNFSIPSIIFIELFFLGIGSLVLFFFSIRKLKPNWNFNFPMWKRLLSFSFPIAVANFFLIAYTRGDLLMLEWIKGSDSVGIYSSAIRLTGSLQILPMALTTTLLPIISYKFVSSETENIREIYRGVFSILLVFGVFVGFSLYFMSSKVIQLMYGSDYIAAVVPLQISGWTQIFSFLLYLLTTMIIGIGYEKYFMIYGAFLFLLKIILNLILIPDYDYVGASLSSFITEFLLMIAVIVFLGKRVSYPSIRASGVVVLSTIFAWSISNYVPVIPLIQFLLAVLVYFVSVFSLGGITGEGLNAIRRLLYKS
ncbi:MAG: flippase [Nitrospinota bacterium]|nr:flippase [Nitrospinota bacterium]